MGLLDVTLPGNRSVVLGCIAVTLDATIDGVIPPEDIGGVVTLSVVFDTEGCGEDVNTVGAADIVVRLKL